MITALLTNARLQSHKAGPPPAAGDQLGLVTVGKDPARTAGVLHRCPEHVVVQGHVKVPNLAAWLNCSKVVDLEGENNHMLSIG